MLRVATRMTVAELRTHPVQLTLVFAMVAVAAGLAVIAFGVARTTNDTFERLVQDGDGAHVWLFSNDSALPNTIKGSAGVEKATAIIRRARVDLLGRESPYQVMLWAIPAAGLSPTPALIRSGRLPGNAGEVAFNSSFADRAGVKLDEIVTLSGPGGSASLRVVGIGVNNSQAPYPLDRPSDVFVSAATVEQLAGGRFETSAIGVRLRDPGQVDAFLADLRGRAGTNVFAYTWTGISSTLEESGRATTILLQTFSVFGFLAVGFVLANTVSAQLYSRSREIALLRAAGLSPGQLTVIVVARYLVLSAVAAVLGVAAGALLTPLALRRVAALLDTTPAPRLDPAEALTVVGITLVVAAVFVALPAWAAGRGTVARALRGSAGGDHPPRRSTLAALATPLRLPVAVRIGLKDAFARPGRVWLTIAAIVLAAATVSMSLTIEATAAKIDLAPQIIGRPPYQLRLTPRRQLTGDSLVQALAAVAATRGVSATMLERTSNGNAPGSAAFPLVTVSGQWSAMPFSILTGRALAADGEALVGEALAQERNLVLGEPFTVTTRGNRQVTATVVGTIPDDDHDGRVFFVAGSLNGDPNAIDLRLIPGTNSGDVAQRIARALPAVFDINDLDARFRDELSDQRDELRRVMIALDGALIGVALANLLGVLALTIRERTRELGILRAIGVTPAQIYGAIATSAGLYAFIGLAAGAPLGYFVTAGIVDFFGGRQGWPSGLTVAPPLSWTFSAFVAGAVVIGLFVMLPARAATRLRPAEALREE